MKKLKQAGAELCQAQDNLGLAKPALVYLLRNRGHFPFIKFEVIFQLKAK
jgi:hypothetical protein